MPAKKGQVIFTYHEGPDKAFRYHFTMEWWQVGGVHYDAKGKPTEATEGPKGQCFYADPKPYIKKAKARGETVVEIDKRGRT